MSFETHCGIIFPFAGIQILPWVTNCIEGKMDGIRWKLCSCFYSYVQFRYWYQLKDFLHVLVLRIVFCIICVRTDHCMYHLYSTHLFKFCYKKWSCFTNYFHSQSEAHCWIEHIPPPEYYFLLHTLVCQPVCLAPFWTIHHILRIKGRLAVSVSENDFLVIFNLNENEKTIRRKDKACL